MKQAMTPEEIKEKKPYLDWSLSEREYDYIWRSFASSLAQLHRNRLVLRNVERALFLQKI
jgi:hypothetical protein